MLSVHREFASSSSYEAPPTTVASKPKLSLSRSDSLALQIWLKICGYTTCECYTAFMALLVICSFGAQFWSLFQNHQWRPLQVNECIELITRFVCTLYIFYCLYRNLGVRDLRPFSFRDEYKTIEFYTFCAVFMIIVSTIRFGVYFVSHKQDEMCKTESITAVLAVYYANTVTMYTLDFVLLYFALSIVRKYDNVKSQIVGREYRRKLTIRGIKVDVDIIQKFIQHFKQQWETVVSVACVYYIFSVALAAVTGIISPNTSSVWIYCNTSYDDEWTQLFIVILRGCVGIFGLLYGILRVNQKSRELAKTINKHCDWTDGAKQVEIARLVMNLMDFPDGCKVLWVRIEWKHFLGLLLSAVTTALGVLVRKILGSDCKC